MFCKIKKILYFLFVNNFNILTNENRLQKFFLIESFFNNKIFRCCKKLDIWT